MRSPVKGTRGREPLRATIAQFPSAALCAANGGFLVGRSEFYHAAGLSCVSTRFDSWHLEIQRSLRRQLDCVPLALPVLFLDPRGHWQSQWHTECGSIALGCGRRLRCASALLTVSFVLGQASSILL